MRIGWALLLFLFLFSCKERVEDKDRRILAQVGEYKLDADELTHLIPKGASSDDSIRLSREFIQTWVRRQLLLKEAEEKLPAEKKDVEAQLREYRRSLLIFALEEQYLKEALDTNVSEEEIKAYYEENQGNFELKENIVKVLYVKVRPETPDQNRLRTLMRLAVQDDAALIELEEYAMAYASNSFLDPHTWLFFNELLKEIPIQTYNQESFLQYNRNVEMEKEGFRYFVRFIDFRIREGVSPLGLEEEKIRRILINKRKINLIKSYEEEVYQKALQQNAFEIYQ
jgi:hypothetical protein